MYLWCITHEANDTLEYMMNLDKCFQSQGIFHVESQSPLKEYIACWLSGGNGAFHVIALHSGANKWDCVATRNSNTDNILFLMKIEWLVLLQIIVVTRNLIIDTRYTFHMIKVKITVAITSIFWTASSNPLTASSPWSFFNLFPFLYEI